MLIEMALMALAKTGRARIPERLRDLECDYVYAQRLYWIRISP